MTILKWRVASLQWLPSGLDTLNLKTSLATLLSEKCPKRALQSVIGTQSLIGNHGRIGT